MRKMIPVLAVAFIGLLAFSSCKKDYTCKCTIKGWLGSSGDTTINVSLGKVTKKDAKSACDGYGTKYPGSTGVSCSL